ncbi:hypothetical protein ACFLWV_03940 [Chloroflexota bacterium]
MKSIKQAVNSFIQALRVDKSIKEIKETLSRIEVLQQEIQKTQLEQAEKGSSGSTLMPTLQALSQYYMDYLAKQETGNEEETPKKESTDEKS